jgi:hypothetical protein
MQREQGAGRQQGEGEGYASDSKGKSRKDWMPEGSEEELSKEKENDLIMAYEHDNRNIITTHAIPKTEKLKKTASIYWIFFIIRILVRIDATRFTNHPTTPKFGWDWAGVLGGRRGNGRFILLLLLLPFLSSFSPSFPCAHFLHEPAVLILPRKSTARPHHLLLLSPGQKINPAPWCSASIKSPYPK